jgi:hypothetical protein
MFEIPEIDMLLYQEVACKARARADECWVIHIESEKLEGLTGLWAWFSKCKQKGCSWAGLRFGDA